MNQPRVRNVACAAVLVFLAAVGALIRYQAGWPLNPLASLGHSSSAEGRGELRAFRRDPVLGFRAPSTRLRSVTDRREAATGGTPSSPPRSAASSPWTGEPGEAVDAYRVRAEASGWRLVATECSFVHRSTSVTLTRPIAGRPATLHVYGYLGRPPPESGSPGVLVTLTGMAPDRRPDGPEGAALRRRNVHCLRSFEPASPSLLRPARLPASPNEICDLLGVTEARRVVPAVSSLEPVVLGGLACRYGDLAAGGFIVRVAKEPRAYYEDRQSAEGQPDDRNIVIDEARSDGPRGAWVDTRIGPVEIS
ncbi:MAG TPA: hypothetical protein VGV86_16555, partial [Acidimicrobiales bacterium]|nr:hypothetical protein [Acidimicrobiales bacterium]